MAGASAEMRQVLDAWLKVTGRGLTARQQASFLRKTEVPQLGMYLRRHGRTWLEGVAVRLVRRRGRRAEFRLSDWIMAARDHSERSRRDEPEARPPTRKAIRGLRPPQLYGDDT